LQEGLRRKDERLPGEKAAARKAARGRPASGEAARTARAGGDRRRDARATPIRHLRLKAESFNFPSAGRARPGCDGIEKNPKMVS